MWFILMWEKHGLTKTHDGKLTLSFQPKARFLMMETPMDIYPFGILQIYRHHKRGGENILCGLELKIIAVVT